MRYSQISPRHSRSVAGEQGEAVTWRPMLELIYKIAAEPKEEKVVVDLLRDTLSVHSFGLRPFAGCGKVLVDFSSQWSPEAVKMKTAKLSCL